MSTKHSDLIAIANADLADKLIRGQSKKANSNDSKSNGTTSFIAKDESPQNGAESDLVPLNHSFERDSWRAVYTLNMFRYALGLSLLVLVTASAIDSNWEVFQSILYPKLFFFSSLALLGSAILFTYLSKQRELKFNVIITSQFTLDVLLSAFLTHATGSVESNFIILYMLTVATGSVVLPQKHALALASGAVIALFGEHLFNLSSHTGVEPQYSFLATYGTSLFASSLLIAYLAERIRNAELRNYIPGHESIEEFLVREEVNALRSALRDTEGNKTEAAKLLGMSFRSFRYKLTKYGID